MNAKLSTWSLLRVNTSTLAVQRIEIPSTAATGVAYTGGPLTLADGYVWIPGSQGIFRVSTTTLKASTITSPLIGALVGVTADSHFLWMNASLDGNDPNVAPTYFVRASLTTGTVTKVSFPGVKGGDPIGDDGTNLWVANAKGIQRINPSNGLVTTVSVPKTAQIVGQATISSAIAAGGIYFTAGLPATWSDRRGALWDHFRASDGALIATAVRSKHHRLRERRCLGCELRDDFIH